jgi:hypothetical protein
MTAAGSMASARAMEYMPSQEMEPSLPKMKRSALEPTKVRRVERKIHCPKEKSSRAAGRFQ